MHLKQDFKTSWVSWFCPTLPRPSENSVNNGFFLITECNKLSSDLSTGCLMAHLTMRRKNEKRNDKKVLENDQAEPEAAEDRAFSWAKAYSGAIPGLWGLHCTVSGGHFHLLPVQDSVSVSTSFHSHGAAVYQVPFRNNEWLPIPQSKVLHSSCGPPAFLALSLPCYSPGFPTSHFPPVPEVTPIPRGPNPRPLLGDLI